MSDRISRADAIEAVRKVVIDADAVEALKALPSADAKPTVVRCKMMIPYGDFREWAKRIREDNPNVIVIPFDAEVASADAVPLCDDCTRCTVKALNRPLAEAVQGEWIHDGQNFKGGLDWCHCSVCGQKTSTNGLSMYNFCPSCGARMKGGDDE